MKKFYKEFYSTGNNRYHLLQADDDLYVATSTFIKLSRRLKFFKPELLQGLKLLKLTPPLMILLENVMFMEKLPNQEDEVPEFVKYRVPKHKQIKNSIANAYDFVHTEQAQKLEETHQKKLEELKGEKKEVLNEYMKSYKEFKERLEQSFKLTRASISLEQPKNAVIKSMAASGVHHLYSEHITGFMDNVYMYHIDMFAKVTIYRVITVKGVVQSIDTFIYDNKIVQALENKLKEI